MKRRTSISHPAADNIFTAVLLTTFLFLATPAVAATSCENLAGLALIDGKVDSAQVVAQGEFVQPNGTGVANPFSDLPAFCRLRATLNPSSDSDIKIEVWLPESGWNGKFQAVGNGGWAGTIPYPALAETVKAGYAGAATDTGHVGGNADFALGHPEKLIDLAYRSIHEMTIQSKVLIGAYYGSGPRLSYYNGCSQGGRQGLAEAQRYPDDFDGIIAGASAWNQMRSHGARTALNLLVNKNSNSVIPPGKYPMIHDAVLNACDSLDGVKDRVIENPTQCHFDYTALACKAADGPDCLSEGQVDSAQFMTSPLKDPKTGRVLSQGHLWPGSELGWATLGGPQPLGLAISGLRNVVFKDRTWDYHSMNISTDVDLAEAADSGGAFFTGDPNLHAFFDRGGKLLMYHGWADPQVTPQTSTIYYNNVVKAVGNEKAANSIALFMVPGMNHCRGGEGTDSFDKVKVLEEWVEQGKKPEQIVASHSTNGQVDKTRPLCPFGQVARYSGTGSTNDAANFSCAEESMESATR